MTYKSCDWDVSGSVKPYYGTWKAKAWYTFTIDSGIDNPIGNYIYLVQKGAPKDLKGSTWAIL